VFCLVYYDEKRKGNRRIERRRRRIKRRRRRIKRRRRKELRGEKE
jgi:hypothetical protein